MDDPGKARVTSLHVYPVKGLSPQSLDEAVVEAGRTLAHDRAYAIENGGGGFDEAWPEHMPKFRFLMRARHERLAALDTRFEPDTRTLSIFRHGRKVTGGRLDTPAGRQIIEQFFAAYMQDELRGPPRLVHAPGHSISDVREKCLSLINLASVRDLSRVVGQELDPLRFRANLYFDGLPAWSEFDWVGHRVGLGDRVVLKVFKRTRRCAAINVNPATAKRDLNLPRDLMRGYNHADLGVYAMVETGGRIVVGDRLRCL